MLLQNVLVPNTVRLLVPVIELENVTGPKNNTVFENVILLPISCTTVVCIIFENVINVFAVKVPFTKALF